MRRKSVHHVEYEERRAERRGSRVVVGGECDRHAVAAQRFDRRQLLLLEEVKRPGKQDRDGARLLHAADALFTRELYVIGRERTMIRRQRRAA